MKRFSFFLAALLPAVLSWVEQSLANDAALYPEAERLAREPNFFAQCIEPRIALFSQLASFALALFGIFWFARRKRLQTARAAAHCNSNATDFDSKSQQGE